MKLSDLPSETFPIPFGASAGGGYIRQVPVSSQIGITNGAASLTDGFPPLNFLPVGSGGVPPFGQDMNGIINQITQWSRWQNAGGLTTFNSGFSTAVGGYPQGALLASASTAGLIWLNLADNNTNNPDSVPTNWTGIATITASQANAYNWAGTFGGTANALTATLSPAPMALTAGLTVDGIASAPNTGSATMNVNGLGTKSIVGQGGIALTGGEINAASSFIYDGTNFVIVSSGATNIPANLQAYVSAGTFTFVVPTGVTRISAQVWGGGGGGGGSSTSTNIAAGGGGGGGYSEGVFAVTPGASITVVVGAGGTGGTSAPTFGGGGGSSSFGSFCSAAGGFGGAPAAAGGTGGAGTGGQLNRTGASGGQNQTYVAGTVYGGGFGGPAYGFSNNGPSIQAAGSGGNWPGSGGNGSSAVAAGGGGAAGQVILRW